jgi:hypothetical protein
MMTGVTIGKMWPVRIRHHCCSGGYWPPLSSLFRYPLPFGSSDRTRDNRAMRKRVLGLGPSPRHLSDMSEWLKLQDLAEVEVTSEADGYPVEAAFNFGAGSGWRAASPGEQRIRLIFDEPQSF